MTDAVKPAWTSVLTVQYRVNRLRERQFSAVSALELQYMEVLNSILNKPNWREKIENPEIAAKWRKLSDCQALARTQRSLSLSPIETWTRDLSDHCTWSLHLRPDHGIKLE
jgi:hypothetical protein